MLSIKKIHLFIFASIALICTYSCDRQDIPANSDNSNSQIIKENSQPDEMYGFSKTHYYHNGKEIKNTLQIKAFLQKAILVHQDGIKKYICTNEAEITQLNSKLDLPTNGNQTKDLNKSSIYFQYNYEIIRLRKSSLDGSYDPNFRDIFKFSINGAHYHNESRNFNIDKYLEKRFDGTTLIGTYNSLANNSEVSFHSRYVSHWLADSENSLASIGSTPTYFDAEFYIKSKNINSSKRLLKFISSGGVVYQTVVNPGETKVHFGSRKTNNTRVFNGINNFEIRRVYSENI